MKKARGSFWMRTGIVLLAIGFGWLVHVLLGFALRDTGRYADLSLEDYQARTAPAELRERIASWGKRAEALEAELEGLKHRQAHAQEQGELAKAQAPMLQITVDNLFRTGGAATGALSEEQLEGIQGTLDKILAVQTEFRASAERYLSLMDEIHAKESEKRAAEQERQKAQDELRGLWSQARKARRVRIETLQVAGLLLLSGLATWGVIRRRKSPYGLLYWGFAVPVYVEAALLLRVWFGGDVGKYVLLGGLLAVAGWGFVWSVRRLTNPKKETLDRQYRDAYLHFLCPECGYPIRRGPREHLYWTRRSLKKETQRGGGPAGAWSGEEEEYTCPACTTKLYERCGACGKVRPTLLAACPHCGAQKP